MTHGIGRALYCEIDPYAQAWIRNLIQRGLVCPGDVVGDLQDIRPADLHGYNQFHAFAGIAVWSYALRRAGVPDSANVWTGSCPCQPFSAAGKGGGFDDERHLWPAFHHLIRECRPAIVIGEQVASKDGLGWLDLVQSDMEGTDYAFGAVDSCSAGFGAPHIRQRLYWMAYAAHKQHDGTRIGGSARRFEHSDGGDLGRLALSNHTIGRADAARRHNRDGAHAGRPQGASDAQGCGGAGELANAHDTRLEGREGVQERPDQRAIGADGVVGQLADAGTEGLQRSGQHGLGTQDGVLGGSEHQGIGHNGGPELDRPGPTNGLWASCDWLLCRDGKWRPVEPGTFPLAHGAASRVGRLRAYGNAINAEQATAFCEAVRELI